jgi:hypothetical protein
LPVVTFRTPLGILPFLAGRPWKAKEKKIKYDPCAGLVQTVQSVIRQEIFLGRPFFVTTTIEGMNPAHGDNRGPSMVWVGGAS